LLRAARRSVRGRAVLVVSSGRTGLAVRASNTVSRSGRAAACVVSSGRTGLAVRASNTSRVRSGRFTPVDNPRFARRSSQMTRKIRLSGRCEEQRVRGDAACCGRGMGHNNNQSEGDDDRETQPDRQRESFGDLQLVEPGNAASDTANPGTTST